MGDRITLNVPSPNRPFVPNNKPPQELHQYIHLCIYYLLYTTAVSTETKIHHTWLTLWTETQQQTSSYLRINAPDLYHTYVGPHTRYMICFKRPGNRLLVLTLHPRDRQISPVVRLWDRKQLIANLSRKKANQTLTITYPVREHNY